MTTLAIHQPNYLPWLGYFHKIHRADIFVFLDDVQYSKNSYTNRVQVLQKESARWLTLPVSYNFGDHIHAVTAAEPSWRKRHLDSLKGFYSKAPCFRDVWPDFEAMYDEVANECLADINVHLVQTITRHLEFQCQFKRSSNLDTGDTISDDRLVQITALLAPGGRYLSGSGGAHYQDTAKFEAAGLQVDYQNFDHPTYAQQSQSFTPGLSVVDAVFSIGWRKTTALLSER